ncbi:MAG: 30S ribosomal protein S20 [Candidatus Eremiobacteraeota bacterium]|nr:30S ribosomal protein S20 [Candidatus Eremiobacteraeota bacterium]MCW5869642.1 30S ribosomal protein S20 [Candidatus Eremiobacteraeota bacterium]
MANTSSAKKAVRVIAKRTERNRGIRTGIKTAVKKVVKAEPGKSEEALREAVKTLDQAAAKNIIHKNKAARKKSRLAKQVNKAAAAK